MYHQTTAQTSRRNTSTKALSSMALSNSDSHYAPYPSMKPATNNGNDTANSQSQLPSFHRTQTVYGFMNMSISSISLFLLYRMTQLRRLTMFPLILFTNKYVSLRPTEKIRTTMYFP